MIQGLGITDALPSELDRLVDNPDDAKDVLSDMISRRARVGWSTHGHTAVDVNIYSSGGRWAEGVRGNVENTDVGKFLRNYLDVDVDEITKELLDKMDVEELKRMAEGLEGVGAAAVGGEVGDRWAGFVENGAFEDL